MSVREQLATRLSIYANPAFQKKQDSALASVGLGQRIAKWRQAAHFSQERLGEQLGITQGEISRYERGVVVPSALRLIRIMNILEVSGKDLRSLVG